MNRMMESTISCAFTPTQYDRRQSPVAATVAACLIVDAAESREPGVAGDVGPPMGRVRSPARPTRTRFGCHGLGRPQPYGNDRMEHDTTQARPFSPGPASVRARSPR